jgi:hypothetical protein
MEYLEIIRPDKRYCDGCRCIYAKGHNLFCAPLDIAIDFDLGTPPNCPLKSEVDCPRCDATFKLEDKQNV